MPTIFDLVNSVPNNDLKLFFQDAKKVEQMRSMLEAAGKSIKISDAMIGMTHLAGYTGDLEAHYMAFYKLWNIRTLNPLSAGKEYNSAWHLTEVVEAAVRRYLQLENMTSIQLQILHPTLHPEHRAILMQMQNWLRRHYPHLQFGQSWLKLTKRLINLENEQPLHQALPASSNYSYDAFTKTLEVVRDFISQDVDWRPYSDTFNTLLSAYALSRFPNEFDRFIQPVVDTKIAVNPNHGYFCYTHLRSQINFMLTTLGSGYQLQNRVEMISLQSLLEGDHNPLKTTELSDDQFRAKFPEANALLDNVLVNPLCARMLAKILNRDKLVQQFKLDTIVPNKRSTYLNHILQVPTLVLDQAQAKRLYANPTFKNALTIANDQGYLPYQVMLNKRVAAEVLLEFLPSPDLIMMDYVQIKDPIKIDDFACNVGLPQLVAADIKGEFIGQSLLEAFQVLLERSSPALIACFDSKLQVAHLTGLFKAGMPLRIGYDGRVPTIQTEIITKIGLAVRQLSDEAQRKLFTDSKAGLLEATLSPTIYQHCRNNYKIEHKVEVLHNLVKADVRSLLEVMLQAEPELDLQLNTLWDSVIFNSEKKPIQIMPETIAALAAHPKYIPPSEAVLRKLLEKQWNVELVKVLLRHGALLPDPNYPNGEWPGKLGYSVRQTNRLFQALKLDLLTPEERRKFIVEMGLARGYQNEHYNSEDLVQSICATLKAIVIAPPERVQAILRSIALDLSGIGIVMPVESKPQNQANASTASTSSSASSVKPAAVAVPAKQIHNNEDDDGSEDDSSDDDYLSPTERLRRKLSDCLAPLNSLQNLSDLAEVVECGLTQESLSELMSLRYTADRLPIVDRLDSIKHEVGNDKLTASCISVYVRALNTSKRSIEEFQPDLELLYRHINNAIEVLKNPDQMKRLFINFITAYQFEELKPAEQERQLPQLPFYGDTPELKKMVNECYPELLECLEAFEKTNWEQLTEKQFNSLIKNVVISRFYEKFTRGYKACLKDAERAEQALLTASGHLRKMDDFIQAQLKMHSQSIDNPGHKLARSMRKSVLSQSMVAPPSSGPVGRMLNESMLTLDALSSSNR